MIVTGRALVAVTADERAAARIVARRAHAARRIVIVAGRRRRVLRLDTAIARRNRGPAAGLLKIAAALIPAVAARPGLALGADGRTCACADDGADRGPTAATQCAADNGTRGAAEQRAAKRAFLRRRPWTGPQTATATSIESMNFDVMSVLRPME